MAPCTRNSQLTNLEIEVASTSQNVQEEPPEMEDHSPTPQNLVTSTNAHDDTEDNDPPSNPNTQPPTPNLTQAIMLMMNKLRRRDAPPKLFNPQVKQPDTFDSSDPKKLNNFILLCNLYFRNNPAYTEDDSKVTFTLTLLTGMALEYFEPMILSKTTLAWEDDWSEFLHVLCNRFGPIDPTADAEDNIDNLRMKDNQCILRYNIEFTRLAMQTGWNDSILWHHYYSGLAERIKDIMGTQGKPSTLEAMKTLAHSIDACHWECVWEKSRSGSDKTSNNNDNNPVNNKSDRKSVSNKPNNNKTQSKGFASNSNSNDKSSLSQTRSPTNWVRMAN